MTDLIKHTALSIKKLFKDTDYQFHIKNNKVNSNYDGVSGFIVNPKTNKIVYVSVSLYTYEAKIGYMFRTAKHLKDWTGGSNNWAKNNEDLINGINKLLD